MSVWPAHGALDNSWLLLYRNPWPASHVRLLMFRTDLRHDWSHARDGQFYVVSVTPQSGPLHSRSQLWLYVRYGTRAATAAYRAYPVTVLSRQYWCNIDVLVLLALLTIYGQTWSQGHNPQGQGQGQGQGRCQGQCGSLFSQNFKTQTFIAGLVMTNFILIAGFSKLVMKLTVSFSQRTLRCFRVQWIFFK